MEHLVVEIKNATKIASTINKITKKICEMEERDFRKYGKNHIFEETIELCEEIRGIIKNSDTIEIHKESYKLFNINDEENVEGWQKYKRFQDNIIKYDPDNEEYWIPLELIRKQFKIKNEVTKADMGKKVFGRKKDRYLYLKTSDES